MNSALSRFTVLDCSGLLPGPYVGKLLASQGARVYKVESPARPDPAREMANGIYYDDLNAQKTQLLFDLSLESERNRFRPWVEKADVLIEAYRPKVSRKLGLDFTSLHRWNPRLIVASLIGFPDGSSASDRPAHDLGFQALAGLISLGESLPGVPLSDIVPPMELAFRISCALHDRERTGTGSHLKVSILESLRSMQSKWVAEFRATGLSPSPGTTLVTGAYPCYALYKTLDGRRLSVSAMESQYWERFCDAIGLPGAKSSGYSTGPEGDRIKSAVANLIAAKPLKEWRTLFSTIECCAEAVMEYPEIFGDGV